MAVARTAASTGLLTFTTEPFFVSPSVLSRLHESWPRATNPFRSISEAF